MKTGLIEATGALVLGAGELAIKYEQEIPQWFVDDCKERKSEIDAAPCGDFLHVARIPEAIVLKWMREGYNVYLEPVEESLKRLRAEASVFALTDRRI